MKTGKDTQGHGPEVHSRVGLGKNPWQWAPPEESQDRDLGAQEGKSAQYRDVH